MFIEDNPFMYKKDCFLIKHKIHSTFLLININIILKDNIRKQQGSNLQGVFWTTDDFQDRWARLPCPSTSKNYLAELLLEKEILKCLTQSSI